MALTILFLLFIQKKLRVILVKAILLFISWFMKFLHQKTFPDLVLPYKGIVFGSPATLLLHSSRRSSFITAVSTLFIFNQGRGNGTVSNVFNSIDRNGNLFSHLI